MYARISRTYLKLQARLRGDHRSPLCAECFQDHGLRRMARAVRGKSVRCRQCGAAKGDTGLSRLAKEFVDEMGHIASDFAAYDTRWTPAKIDADWPGFRAETAGILDALAIRIEREDQDLYPVAERLATSRDGGADAARRDAARGPGALDRQGVAPCRERP